MSMLQRLWSVPSAHDAEATANLLSQLGVMKVACLTDNTAWALVQPGHLRALTVSSFPNSQLRLDKIDPLSI